MKYNSRLRVILTLLTGVVMLKLLFMTSGTSSIVGKWSDSSKWGLRCPCENGLIKGKTEIAENNVTNHNMSGMHGLTLLSEDVHTEHIWPWAGQEIFRRCNLKDWYKHGDLPSTSVIITFIDKESLAALLRTVHSVIQHTPPQILKEVILVEDNCQKDDLHSILDIYNKVVFGDKVYVIRNNKTLGLIRARLQGIRAARGEVVVCMDSHVEVQNKWLEPLLYEIKTNRKTLASSYLDWLELNDGTWQYKHGGSSWKTYFGMDLVFGFQQISPAEEKAKGDKLSPVRCPVTVGTVWAMNKKFFTEIGELDEGMELWGGENLDLPVRVWLFGGRVVNVPCSHVGHLEIEHYRSYRAKWSNVIHRNYKRFTSVWMKEYMQYFEPYFPNFKKINAGDLKSRMALKKRAKHSISWYFKHVFPEFGIPQIHGKAWGKLRNVGSKECLSDHVTTVAMELCTRKEVSKVFFLSSDRGELRSTVDVYTLKRSHPKGGGDMLKLGYIPLYNTNTSTQWTHWKNGPIKVKSEDLCLQQMLSEVIVTKCDAKNKQQMWFFEHYKSSSSQHLVAGKKTNIGQTPLGVKRDNINFQQTELT